MLSSQTRDRWTDRQTVGRCAAHYHFEAHTCWMNRTGDDAVWAWHLGLNEDAWAGRWSEGGKSLGKWRRLHGVAAVNESLVGTAWEFDCRETDGSDGRGQVWRQAGTYRAVLPGLFRSRYRRGHHMYRPYLPALSVLSPTHRLAPSKVRSPVTKCDPLLLASSATPSVAVPASPHPLSVHQNKARATPSRRDGEGCVSAADVFC